MISLHLWRGLYTPLQRQIPLPIDHPYKPRPGAKRPRFLTLVYILLAILVLPVVPIYLALHIFGSPMANTVRNLRWMIYTAKNLEQLHTRQLYDMIALMPSGVLGFHWMMYRGILEIETRSRNLSIMLDQFKHAMQIVGLSLILAPIGLVIWLTRSSQLDETVWFVILLFPVALCWFLIDYILSTANGCLIALLIPSYVRGQTAVHVVAATAFIGLQLFAYLIPLIVSLLVLVVLNPLPPLAIFFVRIILALLTLIATREFITRALMRLVCNRLNATQAEWNLLLGGGI